MSKNRSRVLAGLRTSMGILTFAAVSFALPRIEAADPLGKAAHPETPYRTDRILIQPKPDRSKGPAPLSALHARTRCRPLKTFHHLDGLQVVQLPDDLSVEQAILRYQASGEVEYAEPDYWIRPLAVPDDPKYADGTLWGLKNSGRNGGVIGADIGAEAAWRTRTDAASVIVAVIDSGIRYTHEDLRDNLWRNPGEIPGNRIDDDGNGYVDDIHGIDAVRNTGDPYDDMGHGTHVAGILGAVGNNGKGMVGVAWKVQIMACKFMDGSGLGSHSDAVQSIDYARMHGAKVINASWGSTATSVSLRSAIARAQNADIIFVAAAGNEGQDDDLAGNYPSGYNIDNIIAVGSSSRADRLLEFSNFGFRTVDLMAPGEAIYSTWHTSDRAYATYSGTSMSTPYVSGACALLRAQFPEENYSLIIRRVLAAAVPLTAFSEKCTTGGRLFLPRALVSTLMANFTVNRLSGAAPLTVSFQVISVGAVAARQWDFGDGTHSTDLNPTHVFAEPGTYTVSLTVTGQDGSTSKRQRTIVAVENYRIAPARFDWIDPAGMTRVTLGDNSVSSPISLPFPFVFYGKTYQRLYISANGVIGFVNQSLSTTANSNLPSVTAPNAMIAPYWDNLNPGAGGSVHFGTVDQAPNRRFVISWVKVPRNSTPSAALTFQAVLEEGTNEILFQYLDVQPNSTRGAARGASVGIENEAGNVAAKYTVDGNPSLLANRQAILFLPPDAPSMRVTPVTGMEIAGDAGGPFFPNSQLYTIRNRGTLPLRWSVNKTQEWLAISSTGGTVNPGMESAVTISVAVPATLLVPGRYIDTLEFLDLGGNIEPIRRVVQLEVKGSGKLSVAPGVDLAAEGPRAGPFTPVVQVYTLANTGDAGIAWSATSAASWLTLSLSSGTLAAGASTTITVSINQNALSLPAGHYSDFVFFSNDSNGTGSDVRQVTLEIREPVPVKLDSWSFATDRRLRIRLAGQPQQNYKIEASENLTDWTQLGELVTDAEGRAEFVAPELIQTGQRFFRATAK